MQNASPRTAVRALAAPRRALAGLTPLLIGLVCLQARDARAQAPPATEAGGEVEALKREIAALRDEYAQRIAGLEARIAGLEQAAAPVPSIAPATASPEPSPAAAPPVASGPPAPVEATVPQGAAGAGGPAGSLPIYGGPTASSKVFNPDIAVIGDFLGAAGTNRVDAPPGLEMHEAEASFQAVVDPYARADFFFALSPEGIEVEEGFVTFPTVPGGFLLKVGKLRGAFGKVNTQHNHILPWTDRPLVTRNLVGGEEGISDSGISLSRLLPNRLFFLEATGEVYRGESEVFRAPDRGDLTYVGRLRAYRDLTESTNLDLGGSVAYGHNDAGPDSTTRLFGVDATFRYRPLRRAIYRRALLRAEAVWSRREQEGPAQDAFGAYVSGEYQFARRWFAGARYDYSERATAAALADKGGSLLLTWWPSEFSQIRGQYRRTRYAEGETANEFLFQFQFSIGAHGAHSF